MKKLEEEQKIDPLVEQIDIQRIISELNENGYSKVEGLLSEEESLKIENGTFNHLTFKPFEDEGLRNFIGKDFGDQSQGYGVKNKEDYKLINVNTPSSYDLIFKNNILQKRCE